MSCRRIRERLRRGAGAEPGDEARRHLASCPACAAEARAILLLRLGSEPAPGATLRPGFEARLRARLLSGTGASRAPLGYGGFDRLVRPALATAAALVLVCAGLYVQVAAPQGDADLASLLESDPVFTSILTADPDAVFADPQGAAATEVP